MESLYGRFALVCSAGKRRSHSLPNVSRTIVFATTILGSACLQASGLPSQGTILGIFSNPVVQGYVVNYPSLGQKTFFDNTTGAFVSINNSTDPTLGGTPQQQLTGSSLVWGSSATPPGFSVLNFFGNQVPSDLTQQFQLGTLTYLNGTSDLNSLIFGATISFYDNVVSPSTYLGSDSIIITTTSNLNQSLSQDADYINICGNNSNICLSSIEAFESSQGGNGLTVNLFGTIVGDPILFLDSVSLAPGQTDNGLIGNQPGLGSAPEPGTWATLAAGLIAGFGLLRRKSLTRQ